MSLQAITEGQRVYIAGNTFAVKDALKRAGCHWDGERKMWWIGAAKRNQIESLIAKPLPVSKDVEADRLERDRNNILGTAKYNGHSYFVVGEGRNERGGWIRLMFRDGSKTFFKNADEIQRGKTFRKPVTLEFLQQPREERHSEMCAECGDRRGYIECSDSSGLSGLCCAQCASYSRFDRSFG